MHTKGVYIYQYITFRQKQPDCMEKYAAIHHHKPDKRECHHTENKGKAQINLTPIALFF